MPNRATAGKFIHLIIAVLSTFALIGLSVFWSLENTIEFTTLIFPSEPNWGIVVGILIQYSPNVFLLLATTSEGNQKLAFKSLFWVFSFLDAGTNVGARINGESAIGVTTNSTAYFMAQALGYMLDVGVVFAEELIGYFVSVVLHDIATIITDIGGDPPSWLLLSTPNKSNKGQSNQGQQNQQKKPNQSANQPLVRTEQREGNGPGRMSPQELEQMMRERQNRQ